MGPSDDDDDDDDSRDNHDTPTFKTKLLLAACEKKASQKKCLCPPISVIFANTETQIRNHENIYPPAD